MNPISRKVTMSSTGGVGIGVALAKIGLWGLTDAQGLGIEFPPDIAGYVEFAIEWAVVGATTFAAGWWAKEHGQ